MQAAMLKARLAREAGEKRLQEIHVMLEEVDMRLAESRKDMHDFRRDIIMGAENPRTGKTSAEKMLKYMEERMKVKDALAEKLQLKNAALKVQTTKMEHQLRLKEDMGEVLHVVDFDQLKIENQQYLERIEERNSELLRLKTMTGKAVQVLGDYKATLAALVQQGKLLRKEAADRRAQLASFDSDHDKATAEKTHAERALRRLKDDQQDTDRPQILDYVKLKVEVAELEKKLEDQSRRNEIAEMDLQRTKKM
eukprot:jgi/Astpho2/3012/gw1.00051.69.1_t